MEMTLAWPLSAAHAYNFLLVLSRVAAMVGTAPMIGGRAVPNTAKAALALGVTVVLVAARWEELAPIPATLWEVAVGVAGQVLVGVLLGFAAGLAFSALQMAGQLIGLQMGLSMANMLDPAAEHHVALVDQMYSVIAGLAFLALDGHHWLMFALLQTFDLVPLHAPSAALLAPEALIALTARMPLLAVQIAFPVLAALIVADVALGILVRVAPQMNVFVVGMPLKIAVGLFLIGLTIAGPCVSLRESAWQFLTMLLGFWG